MHRYFQASKWILTTEHEYVYMITMCECHQSRTQSSHSSRPPGLQTTDINITCGRTTLDPYTRNQWRQPEQPLLNNVAVRVTTPPAVYSDIPKTRCPLERRPQNSREKAQGLTNKAPHVGVLKQGSKDHWVHLIIPASLFMVSSTCGASPGSASMKIKTHPALARPACFPTTSC